MKYINLYNFLKSTNANDVVCTFGELEALLGFELPASAFRYPAWWSNTAEGHSHSAAWLNAGWKTSQVKLSERSVRFVRQYTEATALPQDRHARRGFGDTKGHFEMDADQLTTDAEINLYGALNGSLTVLSGVDLTAPLQDDFEVSESGA